MYLSDYSILELFGRFTTVCTVYYSALKYIFIWDTCSNCQSICKMETEVKHLKILIDIDVV